MKHRRSSLLGRTLAAATLLGTALLPRTASAEITLVTKDGWQVYINGRVQTFLNYNQGDGYPEPAIVDGYGSGVVLKGGGQGSGDAYHEFPAKAERKLTDTGKIEELRIRTGFVGNVLGFGIKKQLSADTEVSAYTAVTVYIDSTTRRKYLEVRPDWRESFMKLAGPWGSLVAGRTLGLYSRGATEITYLYGFKYGLGWPGGISSISGSGTGAGLVGFGVLANGFAGGLAYATPDLGGAQATFGLYDANSLVGSATWERVKWPRLEGELTFERKLPGIGMFKVFGNGAFQKIYSVETPSSGTIAGVGYGGRVEVGPVHVGLAGHYGKGVGIDFALQPSNALYDHRDAFRDDLRLRTVSGYYAQAMVSVLPSLDLSAGAGITKVAQNDEDKRDWQDDDMDPTTDSCCDKADPNKPSPNSLDSVGFVTIKQQVGLAASATVHVSESIHLQFEYLRIMFEWYKPTPATAAMTNPDQNFHVVNAGITYAW